MRAIALLGACALMTSAGYAVAQNVNEKQPQPAAIANADAKSAKTLTQQGADEVLASKLVGAEVYSRQDEDVGKIEYLVMNKDGRVNAAVVGVGGFLGIDRKDVALSFDSLDVQYGTDNTVNKVTANVTKDSLNAAPAYVYLGKKS